MALKKTTDNCATPNCPLCPIKLSHSTNPLGSIELYHRDKSRSYWLCTVCKLVFVAPEQHLNTLEQKKIYDLHINVFEDLGYKRFLGRLTTALKPRIGKNAKGLDFGCGPGPVLAQMLVNDGHCMDIFDPIYAPEAPLSLAQYDFITATEVIEHLSHPAKDLAIVWQSLKPGGWLGMMTKLVLNQSAFTQWHYIRDPTHVSFFSTQTLTWLSEHWGTQAHFADKDIILMQKPTFTRQHIDLFYTT